MNLPGDVIWSWFGKAWKGAGRHCLEEELRHAEGFRDSGRRLEYLSGRAVARLGAAEILKKNPGELKISCNMDGRPALDGWGGVLDFSISHSKGRLAVVFGAGGRVGVDVETGPVSDDVDALATRFFLPSERDAVTAGGGAEKRRIFRRIWACKDAVTKCSGRKLWQILKECEIGDGELPRRVEGRYWLQELGGAGPEEVCVAAADHVFSRVYSLELPLHS